TPDGGLVRGWAADAMGNIDTNSPLVDLRLPIATVMPARATDAATFEGNLPSEAAVGTVLNREIDVYAADGTVTTLNLAFTRTAAGWDVEATHGATSVATALTFNANGTPTDPALTVAIDGITVELGSITSYAGLET